MVGKYEHKSMKKLSKAFKEGVSGFTLIEMLIVIAIIAILAGIVLTGVRGFQATARDTKRIGDIRNIQNLLELHFTRNGVYPATFAELSVLGKVPTAPLGTVAYTYAVATPALGYCMTAVLENENNAAIDDAQPGEGSGTCPTNCDLSDVFCVTSG